MVCLVKPAGDAKKQNLDDELDCYFAECREGQYSGVQDSGYAMFKLLLTSPYAQSIPWDTLFDESARAGIAQSTIQSLSSRLIIPSVGWKIPLRFCAFGSKVMDNH